MKLSITSVEEFLGFVADRVQQPFLTKLEQLMSKQTDDLNLAISNLSATVAATVANEAALKSKLDAAVADNVAKQAAIDTLNAQVAALNAQVATATANAANPADAAAVDSATGALTTLNQTLADANAASSPAN